ncbi:MAG: ATP-binding protein [Clostridiales bacterium]|nr:ATP-binding protein [Clostridiales bacterium]
MSYSKEVYSKAEKILSERLEKANTDAQNRFDEISEKIPRIEEIQRELARIGLEISKVFFTDGGKQAEMEKLMNRSLALQQERKSVLAENGYAEDALEIKYTCPICKDTGYVNHRRCKCHKELLKDIERENLQKIAPLCDYTFESFDVNYYPQEIEGSAVSPRAKAEKIKQSCSKYAVNFSPDSPSIMFMGGTGLGKTHLSLAIANVVVNKGYGVLYAAAQNLFSDLQNEGFGRSSSAIKYTEKSVLSCDLLIIDDLGTEFKNSYTVASLFNIINSRLSAKKPTIISTNYSFDELEEKYDQRIISRISGEYKKLVLVGNDIRYLK